MRSQEKWRSNRTAITTPGSIRAAAGRGMPPQPQQSPNFFVSQKRGEVGELRSLLRSLPAEDPNQPQNRQRRREVLKRLIAYMTLGIDVSSLFPEVVLTSATSDVVQKKLISLYLNNYAPLNQELLVLAVNAYQKDLRDVDPRIRGLALKGLTSLRAESTVEYAEEAVRAGLHDPSSYVKRAAIMGVLKLYSLSLTEEYKERIKEKFADAVRQSCLASDPQLIVTALSVMNEIEGGFGASRQIIVNFFNLSEKCDPLYRAVVLSLLADYSPRNSDEMLALLDTLESHLIIASPLIVVGTVKVMLSLLKWHISKEIDHQDWTQHHLATSVIKRAKSALLTLITSASAENAFVVLSFIRQLTYMSESFACVFAEDWELIVPKYTDKPYNKVVKFAILNSLLNHENWSHIRSAILTFLTPPSNIQLPILKSAINLLGNIALKFDAAIAEEISSELVSLYLMDIPSVSSSILPVMAVLLSKYHSLASEILPFLGSNLLPIEMFDFPSLQALVWMSGEFREHTPYGNALFISLLRKAFKNRTDLTKGEVSNDESDGRKAFAKAVTDEDHYYEECYTILKDVLAACCKILFVDPVGIKDVFMTILTTISTEILACPPDLVERFLIIVRLLNHRPEILKKVYGQEALLDQMRVRQETGNFSLYYKMGSLGLNEIFQDLDSVNGLLTSGNAFAFSLPFGGRYYEHTNTAITSNETNPAVDTNYINSELELPTVASLPESIDNIESNNKQYSNRYTADLLGDLDEEEAEEEDVFSSSSQPSQECAKLMD